jgi:putative flippase GtrA
MKSAKRRFGRFGIVGLMGAAVQLFLLNVLTRSFGLLDLIATPAAVEIAILHNFIWHERFTWSDRAANRAGYSGQLAWRLWRFHAANGVISLAGNTLLMYFLVERLKVPAMPAALGAIALCSAANFLVADRWVFASEPANSAIADARARKPAPPAPL